MPLGRGLQSLIPSRNNKLVAAPAPVNLSSDRVWQIPIDEIVANARQPRRSFNEEEMAELTESVRAHGILQPILVNEEINGHYEIVAGERRYRAARAAGLAVVPAIVRPTPEKEKLEIAIIENVQRADLNAIDEAFAYQRLREEFGLTLDQIGKKVGKSKPYVCNMIRLLDLPEEAKQAVISGKLPMTKARALLSLATEAEQLEVLHSIFSDHIPVNVVEETVAMRSGRARKNKAAETQYLESELRGALGTRVSINKRGDKGTIVIDFYSPEELENLVGRLRRA